MSDNSNSPTSSRQGKQYEHMWPTISPTTSHANSLGRPSTFNAATTHGDRYSDDSTQANLPYMLHNPHSTNYSYHFSPGEASPLPYGTTHHMAQNYPEYSQPTQYYTYASYSPNQYPIQPQTQVVYPSREGGHSSFIPFQPSYRQSSPPMKNAMPVNKVHGLPPPRDKGKVYAYEQQPYAGDTTRYAHEYVRNASTFGYSPSYSSSSERYSPPLQPQVQASGKAKVLGDTPSAFSQYSSRMPSRIPPPTPPNMSSKPPLPPAMPQHRLQQQQQQQQVPKSGQHPHPQQQGHYGQPIPTSARMFSGGLSVSPSPSASPCISTAPHAASLPPPMVSLGSGGPSPTSVETSNYQKTSTSNSSTPRSYHRQSGEHIPSAAWNTPDMGNASSYAKHYMYSGKHPSNSNAGSFTPSISFTLDALPPPPISATTTTTAAAAAATAGIPSIKPQSNSPLFVCDPIPTTDKNRLPSSNIPLPSPSPALSAVKAPSLKAKLGRRNSYNVQINHTELDKVTTIQSSRRGSHSTFTPSETARSGSGSGSGGGAEATPGRQQQPPRLLHRGSTATSTSTSSPMQPPIPSHRHHDHQQMYGQMPSQYSMKHPVSNSPLVSFHPPGNPSHSGGHAPPQPAAIQHGSGVTAGPFMGPPPSYHNVPLNNPLRVNNPYELPIHQPPLYSAARNQSGDGMRHRINQHYDYVVPFRLYSNHQQKTDDKIKKSRRKGGKSSKQHNTHPQQEDGRLPTSGTTPSFHRRVDAQQGDEINHDENNNRMQNPHVSISSSSSSLSSSSQSEQLVFPPLSYPYVIDPNVSTARKKNTFNHSKYTDYLNQHPNTNEHTIHDESNSDDEDDEDDNDGDDHYNSQTASSMMHSSHTSIHSRHQTFNSAHGDEYEYGDHHDDVNSDSEDNDSGDDDLSRQQRRQNIHTLGGYENTPRTRRHRRLSSATGGHRPTKPQRRSVTPNLGARASRYLHPDDEAGLHPLPLPLPSMVNREQYYYHPGMQQQPHPSSGVIQNGAQYEYYGHPNPQQHYHMNGYYYHQHEQQQQQQQQQQHGPPPYQYPHPQHTAHYYHAPQPHYHQAGLAHRHQYSQQQQYGGIAAHYNNYHYTEPSLVNLMSQPPGNSNTIADKNTSHIPAENQKSSNSQQQHDQQQHDQSILPRYTVLLATPCQCRCQQYLYTPMQITQSDLTSLQRHQYNYQYQYQQRHGDRSLSSDQTRENGHTQGEGSPPPPPPFAAFYLIHPHSYSILAGPFPLSTDLHHFLHSVKPKMRGTLGAGGPSSSSLSSTEESDDGLNGYTQADRQVLEGLYQFIDTIVMKAHPQPSGGQAAYATSSHRTGSSRVRVDHDTSSSYSQSTSASVILSTLHSVYNSIDHRRYQESSHPSYGHPRSVSPVSSFDWIDDAYMYPTNTDGDLDATMDAMDQPVQCEALPNEIVADITLLSLSDSMYSSSRSSSQSSPSTHMAGTKQGGDGSDGRDGSTPLEPHTLGVIGLSMPDSATYLQPTVPGRREHPPGMSVPVTQRPPSSSSSSIRDTTSLLDQSSSKSKDRMDAIVKSRSILSQSDLPLHGIASLSTTTADYHQGVAQKLPYRAGQTHGQQQQPQERESTPNQHLRALPSHPVLSPTATATPLSSLRLSIDDGIGSVYQGHSNISISGSISIGYEDELSPFDDHSLQFQQHSSLPPSLHLSSGGTTTGQKKTKRSSRAQGEKTTTVSIAGKSGPSNPVPMGTTLTERNSKSTKMKHRALSSMIPTSDSLSPGGHTLIYNRSSSSSSSPTPFSIDNVSPNQPWNGMMYAGQEPLHGHPKMYMPNNESGLQHDHHPGSSQHQYRYEQRMHPSEGCMTTHSPTSPSSQQMGAGNDMMVSADNERIKTTTMNKKSGKGGNRYSQPPQHSAYAPSHISSSSSITSMSSLSVISGCSTPSSSSSSTATSSTSSRTQIPKYYNTLTHKSHLYSIKNGQSGDNQNNNTVSTIVNTSKYPSLSLFNGSKLSTTSRIDITSVDQKKIEKGLQAINMTALRHVSPFILQSMIATAAASAVVKPRRSSTNQHHHNSNYYQSRSRSRKPIDPEALDMCTLLLLQEEDTRPTRSQRQIPASQLDLNHPK